MPPGQRGAKLPFTMGHEIAGEVVALGPGEALHGDPQGPNWRQFATALVDVNSDGYVDLVLGQLRGTLPTQEDSSSFALVASLPHSRLTISLFGTGQGTVASWPGEIRCGGKCADVYATGTTLTLHASPNGRAHCGLCRFAMVVECPRLGFSK